MSVKARGFTEGIPHNKALGMELLELERGEAKFRLPYDEKLVGNPDTGVLHGGAITALLDASSGAAVFAALTEWVPIATLDLADGVLEGPPRVLRGVRRPAPVRERDRRGGVEEYGPHNASMRYQAEQAVNGA